MHYASYLILNEKGKVGGTDSKSLDTSSEPFNQFRDIV